MQSDGTWLPLNLYYPATEGMDASRCYDQTIDNRHKPEGEGTNSSTRFHRTCSPFVVWVRSFVRFTFTIHIRVTAFRK